MRDRALLLFGFFSALRRSELVALDVGDLREIPGGLRVFVRESKTDKEGKGQIISVPAVPRASHVCPVKAVTSWLKLSEAKEGPLFTRRAGQRLSGQAVGAVVKAAAARAGFDPDEFGAHSLRSGFATSAAAASVEERDIMNITRHRSERTVREYIQEGLLGQSHPGHKIAQAMTEEELDEDS